MYRIGSCTVIYDPDESVISNIESYSKYMDLCVVVDNSPKKMRFLHILNQILPTSISICMEIKELPLPSMQALPI